VGMTVALCGNSRAHGGKGVGMLGEGEATTAEL
jgi:hypothetical protein